MPEQQEPLFESNANASIARVTSTFGQRGQEYGDTWRNAQWLALRAVIKKFKIAVPESALRPMAAAVLVDVKYQRLEGGYKDDSIIDGIAYAANLAEEMRAFEPKEQKFDVHQLGFPVKDCNCPTCQALRQAGRIVNLA